MQRLHSILMTLELARLRERGHELLSAFSHLVERRENDALVLAVRRRATIGDIDRLARSISKQLVVTFGHAGLIGLALPNGPAFLAGLLAVLRSGQTALLLDVLAPAEDQARSIRMLGASGVLRCTKTWPDSAADFQLLPTADDVSRRDVPGGAVVKLTSGSTGVPRGVLMPAESLVADEAALASTMALRADDRLLATIPWSHSYGFTTIALSAMVRGIQLVLPTDNGPLSPLVDGNSLGATVFPTVPAYIQALVKMARPPALPHAMRLVISAGAPLSPSSAELFRLTYRQPVHVFYGSSECGGICYDREGGAGERGTVGTPVDGVHVSLAPSPECGPGSGLVTIRSSAVGTRYLPVENDTLDSGRFQTSDVGNWRAGELVLSGRIDRMINVRGRKVDPAEVEGVLAQLEGVDEVVVLGVGIPGGKDQAVRAVIVTSVADLAYADIVEWCRSQLAAHKVPRSIVIVDTLPRTPRGKIDHAALRELASLDSNPRAPRG